MKFCSVNIYTFKILLYRVGWDISVGTLVGNISVSLALVVVGVLLWNESLDAMKIAGIAVCLLGLYVVNRPEKAVEGAEEAVKYEP